MNRNYFRLLLVFNFIVSLLAGIYDFLFPSATYKSIDKFSDSVNPALSGIQEILFWVCSLAGIGAFLVGYLGLLLFKNWARYVYALGFVATIPIYFFSGVSVSGPVAQLANELGSFIDGIIFAVIFLSPLKSEFKKQL